MDGNIFSKNSFDHHTYFIFSDATILKSNFLNLKTELMSLPIMYRAEISIGILKYFGMWCPKYISNGTRTIYNAFSVLMVITVYTFTCSTILYLLLCNPDMEEFTESSFYVLALLTACVKIAIVFFKRSKIIQLTDMLFDEKFHPRDFVEFCIQKKFDKLGRYKYQRLLSPFIEGRFLSQNSVQC